MFDTLGGWFQEVFASLRGEGRLTPKVVEAALRQIRLALLEADVNFKVVKAFVDRVRNRAIDRTVLDSLTPAQQVVGVARDELLALFGEVPGGLTDINRRPQVCWCWDSRVRGRDHDVGQVRVMAGEPGVPAGASGDGCATASVASSDLLYVVDAITGQYAIKSAGEFHRRAVGGVGRRSADRVQRDW